jgi:hypothetical protein
MYLVVLDSGWLLLGLFVASKLGFFGLLLWLKMKRIKSKEQARNWSYWKARHKH